MAQYFLQWVLFIDVVYSQYQSHIYRADFGTSFIPADPIELISTIWVSSEISCTETCNINLLCRTYDYDTLSKRCRLFEGEITTGHVNRSAAIPSTSRVSSIAYTEQLYLVYNQTCDKCQINRYLLCINDICQCTPHTYWNGYMCLNQRYNGSICQNDQWCRNDKNLICSSSNFCGVGTNITSTSLMLATTAYGVNIVVNGDGETGPCETSGVITPPTGWTPNGSITQVSYWEGGGTADQGFSSPGPM
ncbi:unnamed protein product [Didymodactylos carnosus]|uniref:Apple domain-containing protein n=1 Tax=Didymodactylos carnosus TaxID=1234261 RepID=A0A815B790_9BILA|nr:unnamed protein product [Didymodactylos carnosus]CAF4051691.1 unnamed protein product [Didymodactylos carnosus]